MGKVCNKCGKQIGFLDYSYNGECEECYKFTQNAQKNRDNSSKIVENELTKDETYKNNEESEYSNSVAQSFKSWSNGVLIVGVLILIVMIVVSAIQESGYLFFGAILGFTVFIANSLLLLAVAEIIQKLQNIEDNTRK